MTTLKDRIETLTPGELECLVLAARPMGSKQIAEQLGLSPKTVDNRISRAMRRLGVGDRDSAIRMLVDASRTPWGESLAGFSSVGIAGSAPPEHWASRLPLPWPTRWRPENDLSFGAKLAVIVLLAAAMMLVVVVYIVAVIALSRLS